MLKTIWKLFNLVRRFKRFEARKKYFSRENVAKKNFLHLFIISNPSFTFPPRPPSTFQNRVYFRQTRRRKRRKRRAKERKILTREIRNNLSNKFFLPIIQISRGRFSRIPICRWTWIREKLSAEVSISETRTIDLYFDSRADVNWRWKSATHSDVLRGKISRRKKERKRRKHGQSGGRLEANRKKRAFFLVEKRRKGGNSEEKSGVRRKRVALSDTNAIVESWPSFMRIFFKLEQQKLSCQLCNARSETRKHAGYSSRTEIKLKIKYFKIFPPIFFLNFILP